MNSYMIADHSRNWLLLRATVFASCFLITVGTKIFFVICLHELVRGPCAETEEEQEARGEVESQPDHKLPAAFSDGLARPVSNQEALCDYEHEAERD